MFTLTGFCGFKIYRLYKVFITLYIDESFLSACFFIGDFFNVKDSISSKIVLFFSYQYYSIAYFMIGGDFRHFANKNHHHLAILYFDSYITYSFGVLPKRIHKLV